MTSEDSESFDTLLADDDEVWVPAGNGGPGYIEVRVFFTTRAKDRVSKRVHRKGFQNHGTICTEVKKNVRGHKYH